MMTVTTFNEIFQFTRFVHVLYQVLHQKERHSLTRRWDGEVAGIFSSHNVL